MAVITKITTQKKNKDRYNVYIDQGNGEEYAFSVDEDVLIKFRLKRGMELDDFFLSEINYQDDIRKAYNLAVHFLSRKMRTESEVRKYLVEKETDEPIIQEVIHKLYEYQFLNDEEYAFSYVRTQMNTTVKGTELIKRELHEKGINQTIIAKALKEYPTEKQFEVAKHLYEKFSQKNQHDSERVIKQKMEQLLIRKGFPYEIISLALEEANLSKDDNDEMEALRYHGEKAHRKYAKLNSFQYKQKMKESLYRKGFSLDLIEQYINEQMEGLEDIE